MPIRTFRDITTPRQTPTARALRTHSTIRRRVASSLDRAPYSTREPMRAPVPANAIVAQESYRHVVGSRCVPTSVRLQVAQLRRLGLR